MRGTLCQQRLRCWTKSIQNRHSPRKYRVQQTKSLRALEGDQLLAIFDSGWSAGSDDLIASFIESAGDSTFVARVSGSFRKEIDGLRQLVQPNGVDPAKRSFADLENVFSNLLHFRIKENGAR